MTPDRAGGAVWVSVIAKQLSLYPKCLYLGLTEQRFAQIKATATLVRSLQAL